MEPATRRYYRFFEGSWRGPATVRLRAWPRLGPPGWLAAILETRVACHFDREPGEVVHHTEVRWLGLLVFRSVETFRLDPGGEAFAIAGTVGWPRVTDPGAIGGTGRVVGTEPLAATYAFTFRVLGVGFEVAQDTRWEGDHLAIAQRTRWFEGSVRLARR